MTGPISDATADLKAALATVPGAFAVTTDASKIPTLPAFYIAPPRLIFTASRLEPTDLLYIVWAIVDNDEFAIDRLSELAVNVAHAVDTNMHNAAVVQADPGVFPIGQLPSYEIQVEVGL